MYSIFKLKPSYQFPKETLVCSESVNRQDTYSVQFSNKKFFKSTRPRCNDFFRIWCFEREPFAGSKQHEGQSSNSRAITNVWMVFDYKRDSNKK